MVQAVAWPPSGRFPNGVVVLAKAGPNPDILWARVEARPPGGRQPGGSASVALQAENHGQDAHATGAAARRYIRGIVIPVCAWYFPPRSL
jgi:hypothetical protein